MNLKDGDRMSPLPNMNLKDGDRMSPLPNMNIIAVTQH